ncbi:MAG: CPBP family intramembrane glutamic endopeptidase [Anaerolineae bacterium]
MSNPTTCLDRRRIALFLAFAFGIAWATSLVIYLTGGIADSPLVFENVGVTLALLLMAGPIMSAPALAHLLTRVITREGWQGARLRPRINRNWGYWVIAWFGPGLLIIVGMIVFFLFFPRYYDPSLSTVRELFEAGAPPNVELEAMNIWVLVGAQVFQGMLLSPVVNALATFGEEFGWRAYLQPKLMPLGPRKAMAVMGAIWGIWHWPLILMGYNYGFDYPGAPFVGLLAMVWFCFVAGVFLGWLTIKSDSVWPAVIGHAAINGMAGLSALFVQGQPNALLGPQPVGVIGGIGFAVVAAILWLYPQALKPRKSTEEKD